MARIRTIKPEFWADEDLSSVSEPACLLAAGLLNHSDDEGYFRAHHGLIKAAVFPIREPSVSIQGMLEELLNIQYIELFEGADGKKYGKVVNFSAHQRVNRPSPSKIRTLGRFNDISVNPQARLTTGKEQGKERKGTGSKEQGKEQMVSQNLIIKLAELGFSHTQIHTPKLIGLIKAWEQQGLTGQDLETIVTTLRQRDPKKVFGPAYLEKPIADYLEAKKDGTKGSGKTFHSASRSKQTGHDIANQILEQDISESLTGLDGYVCENNEEDIQGEVDIEVG